MREAARQAAADKKGRSGSLLSGLLLSLASVAFTLLAVEIVLHLFDLPRTRQSHQQFFVEHDAVLGWRNVPNASGRLVTDEYARELRYNARSMRGPLIPYERQADMYRVLLVGDSFVDGYTEEVGERVSEVLQEELADDGMSVEVIPMGTPGYSTDQEYLWFMAEGLRYHPDVVVLAFHPNDVWYNQTDRYSRGHKPRFVLESDALVLTGVPVPRPESEQAEAEDDSRGFYDWVRSNSKLYWLLARAVQDNQRAYGLAVEFGLAAPSPEMVFDADRGVVTAGEFSVFNVRPPPETREAWRITRALVSRMRDEANAASAEFLVFMIPIRSRIYTQANDVRANVAGGNSEIDLDAPVREFHDLCVDDAVSYVNPTAAFLEAADSLGRRGERLYYRYDWHWNANGHRAAGEILAAQVGPMLRARATTNRRARTTRDPTCGGVGSTDFSDD